jgi:hypothetical protein
LYTWQAQGISQRRGVSTMPLHRCSPTALWLLHLERYPTRCAPLATLVFVFRPRKLRARLGADRSRGAHGGDAHSATHHRCPQVLRRSCTATGSWTLVLPPSDPHTAHVSSPCVTAGCVSHSPRQVRPLLPTLCLRNRNGKCGQRRHGLSCCR